MKSETTDHWDTDEPERGNAPEHVAPDKAPEICWLLDVRRHGIAVANQLHP
jgi:hypothetical protein